MRLPAALRYVMLHRLAFAVTALTVLITATSTAATAVFASTAASLANKQTLTDNPTSSIFVTVLQPPSAQVNAAVTNTIDSNAPGLPMTYITAAQSNPLNLPVSLAGPKGQSFVLRLDQVRAHSRLVTGRWPRAPYGRAIQACLPVRAAQLLGLHAGSQLTSVDTITHASVPVQITCTFNPIDPASTFWRLNTLPASGISRVGGFNTYGPMVTTEPVASWGAPVGTSEWLAVPDFAAMTSRNLTTLSDSLGNAVNDLGDSQFSFSVTTNLPVLLGNQATTLEVARSELLVWQLILLVIVGAALTVAVQLLASQRANEPSLLMARGASRLQLAARGTTDALLLAVPAAVVGPLIGAAVAPLIARMHLIGTGSVSFPTRLPPTAWYAGVVVAAGCALIVALPWLRTPLTPIQRRAWTARQRTISRVLSSGADIALVLLAAGAAWQLSQYSAPVTTGISGFIGIDPVLVAAPVLALTAGTVVMTRLLPLLIRLAERLAARGRGITVPVAAWMIGRRTMRQAGSALLTVLAVATAVVAIVQAASWQLSIRDQAAFSVGASEQLTLPSAAPLAMGQVADVTAAKGVARATPVITIPSVLPNNDPLTVLALDPQQAKQIVPIRHDLLLKRYPDPLGAIAASGVDAGEVLPGRPRQLQVVASLSRAPISQVSLTMQLTDAAGIGYQIPIGALPTDGVSQHFDVTIAASGRADYPLSITGFSLTYQLPESGSGQLATLTIHSIAVSQPGHPPQTIPAIWPSSDTPEANITQLDLSGTPGLPRAYQPYEKRLALAGHGAILRFMTGAGLSNSFPASTALGLPTTVNVPAFGTVNVTMPGPSAVPAIATASFLAAAGEQVGEQYEITGLATNIPVLIVAEIAQFPTVSGTGGGLIINQAALQAFDETNGVGSVPVGQWWLRVAGKPQLGHMPAGTTTTTQADVAKALSSQPLTVAPLDSLVSVAAVALLLACMAFLVGVSVSRERSRDLAVLDALGATPGQLTMLLCIEQGMLSVPAAAGGLALGLLLSQLIIPAVTLTAAAAHPVPPVIVRSPVGLAVLVAVVVAAIPVVAVAMSIRRGTATVARLRAEEET